MDIYSVKSVAIYTGSVMETCVLLEFTIPRNILQEHLKISGNKYRLIPGNESPSRRKVGIRHQPINILPCSNPIH